MDLVFVNDFDVFLLIFGVLGLVLIVIVVFDFDLSLLFEICRLQWQLVIGFEVQFFEVFRNLGGQLSVGDFDNLLFYLFVFVGMNGDLLMMSCMMLVGDDVEIVWLDVVVWNDDEGVSFFFEGLKFVFGVYCFLVCVDVVNQQGVLFDGDEDGFGGDGFVFDFCIDEFNLLENVYFDCDF